MNVDIYGPLLSHSIQYNFIMLSKMSTYLWVQARNNRFAASVYSYSIIIGPTHFAFFCFLLEYIMYYTWSRSEVRFWVRYKKFDIALIFAIY